MGTLQRSTFCVLKHAVVSSQKRSLALTSSRPKSFRKWYREFWTPKPRFVPPYNHFIQVGDPVLRAPAAAVPDDYIDSKEIKQITEHLVTVMRHFKCVGIAAPQIGVSLRIIAMEFPEQLQDQYSKADYKLRKMSTLPLTIVINPKLKITDYDRQKYVEGCMSVRGYSAAVERYTGVTLTGYDNSGKQTELQLSGWNARIAQHELDHLEGKLYIDHMDVSTFTCTCWEAVNSKGGRVEIPFYK